MASQIIELYKCILKKEKKIAFAESCTGGYLAAQLVAIPNASKVFLGSIVAYSNDLKHKILKVSHETLRTHGAASREVADEMWIGLLKLTGADYGIAITGIAGPTGGTKEKPVGTVFVAFGEANHKPHVLEFHLHGSREKIIHEASERTCQEFLQVYS